MKKYAIYIHLITYHSLDEFEVVGHHVLEVVSDKHSSHVQLDLRTPLGVGSEHVWWGRLWHMTNNMTVM